MSLAKIFIAGDFCSKPSTEFISVHQELKDRISSCDIKVINFEVPLKVDNAELSYTTYERFYQNDDTPLFLNQLGFNLYSIANNHIFDWGIEGYNNIKNIFGDKAFGVGVGGDAYELKIQESNGLKIGFLALCYSTRNSFPDDIFSENSEYKTAHIGDTRVAHIIYEAKVLKKEVDYLFVLPHAGIEYIDFPMPEIISLYRDYINWGADGVIASHPHCPQGWEIYKGKPIFYSLGNFFFNSKNDINYKAKTPHWYEGLCVELRIENDRTVSYDVINIKNKNNREIVIDNHPGRTNDNEKNCNILKDKQLYSEYLTRLALSKKEAYITAYSLGLLTFDVKLSLKIILKLFIHLLKGRRKQVQENFNSLRKDEARMNLFKTILK